jgi:hypothetical protein
MQMTLLSLSGIFPYCQLICYGHSYSPLLTILCVDRSDLLDACGELLQTAEGMKLPVVGHDACGHHTGTPPVMIMLLGKVTCS